MRSIRKNLSLSGNIREIYRHELKNEDLQTENIFRLKHVRSSVFASETFVNLVNQHDLTGLHMTKIWSSETGGLPYTWPRYAPRNESIQKRRLMREKIAQRDAREAAKP